MNRWQVQPKCTQDCVKNKIAFGFHDRHAIKRICARQTGHNFNLQRAWRFELIMRKKRVTQEVTGDGYAPQWRRNGRGAQWQLVGQRSVNTPQEQF
jgi:hypothetical protein